MGQSGSSPAPKTEAPVPATPPVAEEKPKKRPCCACPETRKARDECIAEYGQEACELFIQAHKECMRKEGFNI